MKRFLSVLLIASFLIPFAQPVSASGTVTYYDQNGNNVLSIPADWEAEPASGGVFQVTFLPSSDSALMQYGSIDLWSSLSSSAQENTPRSQLDNDVFTKSDIADLIGCKTGQIKMVTLGKTEYFRADFQQSSTSQGIRFSVDVTAWTCIQDGWLYLYFFTGSNSLYSKFEDVVESASYRKASSGDTGASSGNEALYHEAVAAYYSGNYTQARKFFTAISSYQDSSKYLRLIRIRMAGGNIGVGSAVYQKDCGLTQSEKNDIDAAARDFYFADTADVLLCNPDVACYYLVGDWNGGSKCYIHFKMNDYGGTYNIGSKLSTNYQGTFSIFDGEVRVDVLGSNALTLQLTLTGPDTMEVFTYEKGGKCYTLNR